MATGSSQIIHRYVARKLSLILTNIDVTHVTDVDILCAVLSLTYHAASILLDLGHAGTAAAGRANARTQVGGGAAGLQDREDQRDREPSPRKPEECH